MYERKKKSKNKTTSCHSQITRIELLVIFEQNQGNYNHGKGFIYFKTGWTLLRSSYSKEVLPSQSAFSQVRKKRGGSEHLKSGYGHLTWHWSNCWLALSESHRLIPTWSTAGSGSGNAAASNAQADHLASSQETSSSPSTFLPKSSIFFIIDWAVNVIIKGGLTDEIVSPPPPPQCTQLTLMAETPRLANQLRIFWLCPSPHFLVSDWYLIMSGHSSRWTQTQTPSRRTPYTTPDLCPPQPPPHRSVAVETCCLWKWGGQGVGGRRYVGETREEVEWREEFGGGVGGGVVGGYMYLVFQTKLATG